MAKLPMYFFYLERVMLRVKSIICYAVTLASSCSAAQENYFTCDNFYQTLWGMRTVLHPPTTQKFELLFFIQSTPFALNLLPNTLQPFLLLSKRAGALFAYSDMFVSLRLLFPSLELCLRLIARLLGIAGGRGIGRGFCTVNDRRFSA